MPWKAASVFRPGSTCLTLLLLLAALIFYCSAGLAQISDQSALTVDTQTLPDATLYRHPETGIVRSMLGNFSFYGMEGSAEDIARQFLSDYSDILSTSPDTNDLAFDNVIEGEALRHVWFQQYYQGIPLWRGFVVVHMTRDQSVVKVDSAYTPAISLRSLSPTLSPDEAAYRAQAAVSQETDTALFSTTSASDPTLYIYASDELAPRLVWVTYVTTADNVAGWRVTVDATAGSIIEIYDTRVFYTGQGYVFLPNPIATYSGNPGIPSYPNNERKDVTFYNLTVSNS